MKIKIVLAAYAALALCGCASTDQVRLPDGSMGHAIRCGNVSQCMNKAASICGGPYEIIDTQSGSTSGTGGYVSTRPVFDPVTRKTTYVPVTNPGVPGSSYKELVFACRESAPGAKSDTAVQAEIQQEILKFSQDPRYPHYQRLKLQMAEFLETGKAESLEDAYTKACAQDEQCSAEHNGKP